MNVLAAESSSYICNITQRSEDDSTQTSDRADIIPTENLRDGGEIGIKTRADRKDRDDFAMQIERQETSARSEQRRNAAGVFT